MRRFLFALILAAGTLAGFAQEDASKKLSTTTQMFLDEMAGNIVPKRTTQSEKQLGLTPVDKRWQRNHKNAGRIYAAPDTIDGKAYIAAYVRLADPSRRHEIEAQGVIVQEEFSNGLFTTLIPVDKVRDVAAIGNVKRVNVSSLKRITTKTARATTNVDDLLTLSADAIGEGLTQKYDGTGVLLGIIDTGIDFNHIAFKDKNGNSRIKRAYVYNGYGAEEYTSITSTTLTDDNAEDHGTHTSTTAGGSSVRVNGTNVSVTDDHANATYGGMAPGSDLYLAGIYDLNDTYLSNAVKKIVQYADDNNMPVVVSNSWGSQWGPHDGTGDVADVYKDLFGDDHPNHIALFAASNDGAKSKDGEGGGYHISGTASSSSPLSTIVRADYYTNTDGGYFYKGLITNAWARSTSVSKLGINILVLDASTGEVLTTGTITQTGTVSGLSTYYDGTLNVYYDEIDSDKTQVVLYSENGIKTMSSTTTTKNGETYYKSNYTLAIQVYPTSGSSVVDIWGGDYGYFTNHLSTSGYNWMAGSDDMCVSDEAMVPNAISIGAYVSANTWKDYQGTTHSMADEYTIGDIASFSSYATAAASPDGQRYPWITAPGARLAAGVNHNHTTSVDEYSYYGSKHNSDLVVNSTKNPYAMMEGTSMATPVAAGIVALWLQASMDEHALHKNLTVNDVKQIMAATAINDDYTTNGPNASHFGNGKIDALAGIKYILGATNGPTIRTNKQELSFEGYATLSYQQTVGVTGFNLEGDISVTMAGDDVFTIDKTTIEQTDGSASATLTIGYAPTEAGTHTATITLASQNAESVTISITGTAEAATPTILADKQELAFSAQLGSSTTQTVKVSGRFLTQEVTATLADDNGVFSVDNSSFAVNDEGVDIAVTFSADVEGSYTASLLLASEGANSIAISLSAIARDGGTASDPFLNIANYATIDEAGWNTTLVNNLYKYTEYEDDEVAWLTMPVYGAYASKAFEPKAQNWIAFNGTGYAGTTWGAEDVYAGSSSYFTSATSRSYGNTGGSTKQTVSFYVSNITGAKLYGKNTKNVDASSPTSLKVYECTLNGDGTLTVASEDVKSAQNATAKATFNIGVADLDASKIYKVDASIYQGYLYEIAFQTPLEVEKIPTIKAEPAELTFEPIYATTEATQSFTLKGKYLTDKVTLTLSDENGAFSIDKSEVSAVESAAGAAVAVSFHPVEAGTFSATLTLTSEGAAPVSVSITGTAEPATPTILVDEQELTFVASLDTDQSQAFRVNGRFIHSNVTFTLSGDSHVFSVNPATLAADQITEDGEGAPVAVTFNASEEGTYNATLTLASEGAEPVAISLTATANDGGTASDAYLNIAKYATIDDAGWNTTHVNTLYKYTEYEDDEVAWLTLPIYGAWSAVYYSPQAQKWIATNVNNTNSKYTGTSWSSNTPLMGSSPYFTGSSGAGSPRVMGYNAGNNKTQETVTFYVTNTTAVNLLGLGQSKTNSSYPTTLKIYECTVNGDGSLTPSSSAVKSESNSATSGTFVLSATDLDASKVYKVEAGTYRSYIAEIAFQTPMPKKYQLGDVNHDGEVTIADALAIVRHILGEPAEGIFDEKTANVNLDDGITITDAAAVISIILQ